MHAVRILGAICASKPFSYNNYSTVCISKNYIVSICFWSVIVKNDFCVTVFVFLFFCTIFALTLPCNHHVSNHPQDLFPILYQSNEFCNAQSVSFREHLGLFYSDGFIILLTYITKRLNWLHYASYYIKRIIRCFLCEETYGFGGCFDFAFILRPGLEHVMWRGIPIPMVRDIRNLFKIIVKANRNSENSVLIYIYIRADREAYERREISRVGWTTWSDNIVDALTKLAPCKALHELTHSARLNMRVQQWVIRSGDGKKECASGIFANPKTTSVGSDKETTFNGDRQVSEECVGEYNGCGQIAGRVKWRRADVGRLQFPVIGDKDRMHKRYL